MSQSYLNYAAGWNEKQKVKQKLWTVNLTNYWLIIHTKHKLLCNPILFQTFLHFSKVEQLEVGQIIIIKYYQEHLQFDFKLPSELITNRTDSSSLTIFQFS